MLSWPEELVREYLNPPGADELWAALLPKLAGVTIAREPLHCGGMIEANRLFERFARVFFQGMLGADLP